MFTKQKKTFGWMLSLVMLLLVSFMPSDALAQTIKGTVVDSSGEPIIGASVTVVGGDASKGSITDFDGNFAISAKPGTKLNFNYVGMVAQVFPAKDGMKVILKEDAQNLEEVTVVAYGTQKKVTVTGAVSAIKSEDLVRTPVSSVNNVLAGQLSGVTTVQYSGEPGSDAADIFVRGKATWGDASPLIQVDGVEREMWDIDPNEIESVTVLKDASATAVFGVRGANGVILITTKRGAEGKAHITVNTNFSALTPTKLVELANSVDYARFYNQMKIGDGNAAEFSDDIINRFATNSDPVRFPNMDWMSYIMKEVTLQQQHNVNISGGNSKVKYFLSAGYFSQDGMFESWGRDYDYTYQYQRFNYRGNVDINVTKTTKVSASIAGKVDDKASPRTGQGAAGMIKAIYESTPFSSPGFVDGRWVTNTDLLAYNTMTDPNTGESVTTTLPFIGNTPMTYAIYQPGAYQDNSNKIMLDLALDQQLDFITKGLSLKLKGSYNTNFSQRKTLSHEVATYTPVLQDNGDILYLKAGQDSKASYSASQGRGRDWYAEGSLNYRRSFGDHTVTALALYNQSKEYYPKTYVDIPRTYVGLVGRVTYDYANKYMAEFNIGYNGSENFAPDRRFGTFPAGSIGWVVSDEAFFKPIKKVVSFMKLRASWGLVGNDKVPSNVTNGGRFMYLADPYEVNGTALMERTGKDDGAYAYFFGQEASGATQYGAVEKAKNNPEVTWEKAFKQDYGVDMNFFNDRLKTTFDYFMEHRTDILERVEATPAFLGFTVPFTNFGEVKSWGWEVSANWNDKIGKNFRYWAKLNLSYNQNKIIKDGQAPQAEEYMKTMNRRIGARSMYQFWGYYYDGCEQDYMKQYGVDKFPDQAIDNSNLKPGDVVIVDLNGDGVINDNDKTRDLGYTDDPQYILGVTVGAQWKGFSFNAQFTSAWDVTRYLGGTFMKPFYNASGDNHGGLLEYHLNNSWTPENPDANAEYPRATIANAGQNYSTVNLYEKDAKYFRCKTMQIAYDFNMPWMKKIKMSQLQVSLSAYNLFTFTSYKWGDPESRASTSPTYPLQRTYTLGLKVGF